MNKPADLTYRVAVRNDETDIFAVMTEVAPEVPTVIGPNTETIIRECVDTGESWVAIDPNGVVVGFALAKPDKLERFMKDNEAISLRYIGVSPTARNQRVCSTLIGKLKERGVPVTATVLHKNTSSMADRFERYGFDKGKVGEKDTEFRWEKKVARQ